MKDIAKLVVFCLLIILFSPLLFPYIIAKLIYNANLDQLEFERSGRVAQPEFTR